MYREGMEEGENFRYLGVIITTDGRMGEEVIHRLQEGRNIYGGHW